MLKLFKRKTWALFPVSTPVLAPRQRPTLVSAQHLTRRKPGHCHGVSIAEIQKMADAGMSSKDIAAAVGATYTAINEFMKRHNIKIKEVEKMEDIPAPEINFQEILEAFQEKDRQIAELQARLDSSARRMTEISADMEKQKRAYLNSKVSLREYLDRQK
jgi:DNA-binding transcriptional MerR regulator